MTIGRGRVYEVDRGGTTHSRNGITCVVEEAWKRENDPRNPRSRTLGEVVGRIPDSHGTTSICGWPSVRGWVAETSFPSIWHFYLCLDTTTYDFPTQQAITSNRLLSPSALLSHWFLSMLATFPKCYVALGLCA